jgi:hypothetical protein
MNDARVRSRARVDRASRSGATRAVRPLDHRIGWIVVTAACASPWWLACGSDDNFVPVPVAGAGDATVSSSADGNVVSDTGSFDGPSEGPDASVLLDGTVSADAGSGASVQSDGSGSNADASSGAPDPGIDAGPPTVALLRIANWSPDSPPVDVCTSPHGAATFSGPLIAALAASSDAGWPATLAFPLVSAYLIVAPGQYDVRIVAGGALDCSVGIGSDATSLPALVAGASETVALVGEASPTGGDPPLQLVGLLDDVSSTAPVAMRCFNAAPALPRIDFGTGTLAALTFKPLFQSVLFGQASNVQAAAPTADASIPTVDGHGYETIKSLSNATLSAHLSMAATDAISSAGFYAASGTILTIAVVDGTSAETPPAPKLLECVDNAGTVGSLSNCQVLP